MTAWIISRRELGWAVPEDNLIESLQTVATPILVKNAKVYA